MKNTSFLILLVLLSGCLGVPTRYQNDINITHQAEKITQWHLTGRLAISTKKESGTVILHWSQQEDNYVMRFILPLGQGSYLLSSDETGSALSTAKDQVFYAQDAEALVQQFLGWSIPTNSFKYWVRGLAEPHIGVAEKQFDQHGRITKMRQRGWDINIKHDTSGIILPDKIFLQNHLVNIRLAIQHWDIN